MLDLTLFRTPAFAGASIVAFAISASMFSMFLFLTLYIQDVLGYDPLQAGLRFLPVTLLSFVVAPISGRLSVRVPVRAAARHGAGARERRAARDDRRRRQLRLDDADPGVPARGRRHRHDQPTARLHRDRRRAPLAQRHGLRHQQHLPPGRHRHRHRRPRRRLPAPGHEQHHRRARLQRRRAPGARRRARPARRRARLRRSLRSCAQHLPPAARGALGHAYRDGFTSAFTTILDDRRRRSRWWAPSWRSCSCAAATSSSSTRRRRRPSPRRRTSRRLGTDRLDLSAPAAARARRPLVAIALEHRQPRIARIRGVLARAPAQREHRAARVAHELLVRARVAQARPRPDPGAGSTTARRRATCGGA